MAGVNFGWGSGGYTVTNRGTNAQVCPSLAPTVPIAVFIYRTYAQGNHYCHRDGANGRSGYYYSNKLRPTTFILRTPC